MHSHSDSLAELDSMQTSEFEVIHDRLEKNLDALMAASGHSTDVVVRRLKPIGHAQEMAIIYIAGLVENDTIMNNIIEPLQQMKAYQASILESVKQAVTVSELETAQSLHAALISLYEGHTIILMDGQVIAYTANSSGGERRNITEPTTQMIIRGPRDSFTESIITNTALIRRKIRSPKLWLETFHLGTVSKTAVSIMYIDGIVQPSIVEEVKKRIQNIKIDSILESGYIEEYIQDKTLTPFPTIQNTDRPDTSAAALLEGRVVIIVDGSPFVLIVPTLFNQFFQASEDYYQRWDVSSLIRLLRYVAFFIASFAPAIYIAITTYHQEMVPSPLLFTLAAQREGTPFPAFIEAVIMELVFEVLREAAIRTGKAIGNSISIVGTLVIGQAAVEAGIVAAAMVIVVAITAISNFVLPSYNLGIAARIIRFVFMALAATLGLYGITVGLIVMILHLCNLKSFGIPYLSSLAPYYKDDQQDVLIRLPRWMMIKRPAPFRNWNENRESKNILENKLEKK